jgi:hypothetical protein
MQPTVRRTVLALSLIAGVLTACASEQPPVNEGDPNANRDATAPPPPPPPAAKPDSGNGKACKANCTSDAECQSTCPPAPNNGLNCCDRGSGVCFASSTGTCTTSTGGDGGSNG